MDFKRVSYLSTRDPAFAIKGSIIFRGTKPLMALKRGREVQARNRPVAHSHYFLLKIALLIEMPSCS